MSDPAEPQRSTTVRELLDSLGVPEDEIEQAQADGTLGLLAVDHLIVPEAPLYTQDDMVTLTGLGDDVRRFWRALGFIDPKPGERLFSDFDLEMLRQLEQMLDLVDREVALQMARVIGSSMARIASAQVDAVEAQVAEDGALDGSGSGLVRTALVLPGIPRVLEYAWRHHMRVAARRRMVREAGAAHGGAAPIAVGFADLVGFTVLSQQLSDHDLAVAVGRFETLAYDTVTAAGGRVVKMIGDEVMFSHPDPAAALEIAISLSEAYRDDEALSDVRVAVAYGPVLEREGDLFGPTVNLASRIVSIAYPGSVLVAPAIFEAVEGSEASERLTWRALRPRQLKHIGRVRLWVARRAPDRSPRSAP